MEVLHHIFSTHEILIAGKPQDPEVFLFRPTLASLVGGMQRYWSLSYGASPPPPDPPSDYGSPLSSYSTDHAWTRQRATPPELENPDRKLFQKQLDSFYNIYDWLKPQVDANAHPDHILYQPSDFTVRRKEACPIRESRNALSFTVSHPAPSSPDLQDSTGPCI